MRRTWFVGGMLATVTATLLLTGNAVSQNLDPALLEARRQKSNQSLNLLTYRHFDELFPTRAVLPGDKPWILPRSTVTLPEETPVTIGGQPTTLSAAMRDMRVNALLVLKDGKLVTEIHRNGGDQNSRYIGYSMSKSWIALLFGVALAQGAIHSVDDPVIQYLPELKGTAYEGVTLRNLLTMRAGTSWKEEYQPGTELDKVRDDSINAGTAFYEDIAKRLTRVAPPGSVFNYSSVDAELAGVVIARATGRNLSDYMSEHLWRPLGAEAPGYWVMQGVAGRQHEWYSAGYSARLRDFARLGQMMLDGGVADGRRVLPQSWVDEATHTKIPGAGYYYFWWAVPGLPDAFAAVGFAEQRVFVDRPTRTVMVMASYNPADPNGGAHSSDLFKSVVSRLK